MDGKLKNKISRILLILGIVFLSSGLLMLVFDVSWINKGYRTSHTVHYKNTVNGWTFLLIGGGMLFGRFQFNRNQ